jgi:phosphatidylserine decarboxylase
MILESVEAIARCLVADDSLRKSEEFEGEAVGSRVSIALLGNFGERMALEKKIRFAKKC